MTTYVYETIDPQKPVRQFEVRQSMNDAPLTEDPETGEPIRRVISGGFGYASKAGSSGPGTSSSAGEGGGGHCGKPGGCGCH